MKIEMGQNKFSSPDIIKEGNKIHTSPLDISNSLNRQYISQIRNLVKSIPKTSTNPLDLYSKVTNHLQGSFTFTQISMPDLYKNHH